MPTLTTWFEYIEKLHTVRIDLGLERIQVVAESRKLTHFNCPVIMVAGTNGKGSCIKILESIYLAAGYRVGAYTSPHLIKFNERIRVNNVEIDDGCLLQCFEYVENARAATSLSFFEFTTLGALYYFQRQPLDVLLLEVGLGGRLDAVNIVEPDVSIIASIDLDHEAWLGDTREQIAIEKAGIMRAAKPVICGELDPPSTIASTADKVTAKLYQINRDFQLKESQSDWHWQSAVKQYTNLPKPSLLCQNAATSLMAIECLQNKLPVQRTAVCQGLQNTKLAGRFEMIAAPFPCIVDVAHNPACARILASQLAKHPFAGKTIAIIGMLADKNIVGTCQPLLDQVDEWCAVSLLVERGAKASIIMQALHSLAVKSCYNLDSVESAMQYAMEKTEPIRVLVFGSFYTVAFAKQIMERSSNEYQN